MTEQTRGCPLWSKMGTLRISKEGVTCGSRAVVYKDHTIARKATEGCPASEDPAEC